MDEGFEPDIARLARDAQSGASELLPRALDLLRRARASGPPLLAHTARAICRAQPSMAAFWNAAASALADAQAPGTLDDFEQRSRRAGAAIRRVAAEALFPALPLAPDARRTRHVTTFSFSGTVAAVVSDLARRGPLTVACAEGRPGLEGRRLAAELSARGVRVELFTDAAVGLALAETEALLLGADGVAGRWFVNKCGTSPLAAAASLAGVPVYVLATRDKFLPPSLEGLLALPDHAPAEVWASPPDGTRVRNPYFERIPLELASGLVTDAGLLGTDMAEEVCRANGARITREIVEELSR